MGSYNSESKSTRCCGNNSSPLNEAWAGAAFFEAAAPAVFVAGISSSNLYDIEA